MTENQDITIGQPLRDRNSKCVWVDDPDNAGERIKIIVERRNDVVQLLEEHLNRNGGDFHMAPDLGDPVPAEEQPARAIRREL